MDVSRGVAPHPLSSCTFASSCAAGCAGCETDWKVRSPFYNTPRLRENGYSYPFASSCSASCAGRETDWKVRSPFYITSRVRENGFSYPLASMLGGLCRTCNGLESPFSFFHHFEGTGERVFLPVCALMLGGLCRMCNGLESPFSFLHHSEGTGERVFLPVCVLIRESQQLGSRIYSLSSKMYSLCASLAFVGFSRMYSSTLKKWRSLRIKRSQYSFCHRVPFEPNRRLISRAVKPFHDFNILLTVLSPFG